MVLGCLHSAPLREHARYLWGRKRLPLRPLTAPTGEGGLFAALQRVFPNLLARKARKNTCILAATWGLVDERFFTLQDIAMNQALIWRLGCTIKVILQEYRQRRAEEAGEEVETLMGSDPPLHQEAWHRIKGWYKAAVDRALTPAWITLKRITGERVELYS